MTTSARRVAAVPIGALRIAASSALTAALVCACGCAGRPRWSAHRTEASRGSSSGPAIAVLDLSDGLPEQASAGLLGLSAVSDTIEDAVSEIDRLERDGNVRGILVRLGTARLGLGRAEEIGSALGALRAKHPVWCHADEYGNGSLLLAARGCTRVWVAPVTSVDAIGIAAQTLYFHRLLADELGLDVDFLQVGKFKGAEEPFTRDGPSAEARASLESTLADLRTAWLTELTEGRPGLASGASESGPLTPDEAKAGGLVDEVGYFDEARAALEKATGATHAEVRLGPGASGDSDFVDALRAVVGGSLGSAPIVVVRASGAISMEGGGLVGGNEGIAERRLVKIVSRLDGDDDVKAVVLRIDSPGGSALASDLIWHTLMHLRAKKTLVVSVGDMAASGGYYLASSGARIFADATSIVGSIGVVGGKIAADHALEKIGVHAQTFPANAGDPHAAARAAYESLLVPWDDEMRARVLDTMTGVYRTFLSRVAEGRGIPVEKVAASAEGRIFGGRDARARGLVDEIGGLREAIASARALAGLPADARVDVAEEATGLARFLGENEVRAAAVERVALSGPLRRAAIDWAPFVDGLAPLAHDERIACTLPFALIVR